MAKSFGKLMKLRSALERINFLGNSLSRSSSSASAVSSTSSDRGERLQTVYVGMSRPVYQVDSELLDHPAVQELVEKSKGSDEISVGCEVVLFDHLRRMINNSDSRFEPIDNVTGFYAY